MLEAPAVDWKDAQAAVREMGTRVGALVRSVRRPDAPCLGDWTVVQLAAHLSHAMDGVHAMALGGGGILEDIWKLGDLTGALVIGEAERDPVKLGDRIEASVENAMTFMAERVEDDLRTWFIPKIDVPFSFLTCHLLNELTVHGRDIAQAEGVPWPIPKATARLVVEGFILPVLSRLGRQLVDQESAKGVRVTYYLHVRGGGGATLRFDDGDLTVTPGPPTGRIDCHISADPGGFLLVTWGRISQWNAIGKGQLLAYGRKPWMGLKLRSMVRNP
ncbi:MAG TPA: maleylpyruvate isomerase N-terminal domain-containing protein [Acidimicrobiales bacterium]